jgi:hypothetical protein
MRLIVWQCSANGAIPDKIGAEWYNAHKARIRKGYFQEALRVHTRRRNCHGIKGVAEASQVTASDELFAAHSRPLPGLRKKEDEEWGLTDGHIRKALCRGACLWHAEKVL